VIFRIWRWNRLWRFRSYWRSAAVRSRPVRRLGDQVRRRRVAASQRRGCADRPLLHLAQGPHPDQGRPSKPTLCPPTHFWPRPPRLPGSLAWPSTSPAAEGVPPALLHNLKHIMCCTRCLPGHRRDRPDAHGRRRRRIELSEIGEGLARCGSATASCRSPACRAPLTCSSRTPASASIR